MVVICLGGMHLSSLNWDLGVLAKAPTQIVPGLRQGFLSEAVGTTGAGISRDVPGCVMHPPRLRRGELARAGLESMPETCVCGGGRPQPSSAGVPAACPGVVQSTQARPLAHLAPSPLPLLLFSKSSTLKLPNLCKY